MDKTSMRSLMTSAWLPDDDPRTQQANYLLSKASSEGLRFAISDLYQQLLWETMMTRYHVAIVSRLAPLRVAKANRAERPYWLPVEVRQLVAIYLRPTPPTDWLGEPRRQYSFTFRRTPILCCTEDDFGCTLFELYERALLEDIFLCDRWLHHVIGVRLSALEMYIYMYIYIYIYI